MKENKDKKNDILKEKKIVISGKFNLLSREEIKNLIEDNGGKNISSISKSTTLLIAGENMGPSKLKKAQELEISIISEEEFLSLVNYQENMDDKKQSSQGELF